MLRLPKYIPRLSVILSWAVVVVSFAAPLSFVSRLPVLVLSVIIHNAVCVSGCLSLCTCFVLRFTAMFVVLLFALWFYQSRSTIEIFGTTALSASFSCSVGSNPIFFSAASEMKRPAVPHARSPAPIIPCIFGGRPRNQL